MRPLEIAICGCGPAGLAAALLLHRQGHRIVLVERFAEPRPLGSGLLLQPTGLAVLEQLGLARNIAGLGQPVTRLFGKAVPSGRTTLDVRYAALGSDVHAIGIHRAALFGALFAAVQAETIAIETGFEIASLDWSSDGRPLLTGKTGRRLGPFDLAIDALGSRSTLAESRFGPSLHRPLAYGALWASLPWPGGSFDVHALEQRYRAANRMVGVLPTGRRAPGGSQEAAFFWSLKPRQHAAWLARGLEPWKDDVRALWPETEPLLGSVTDPAQMVLASYGHHTLALPVAGRLAVIGDAAHATSPQLGQGANMALMDAAALAAALQANDDLAEALASYARLRRWHVRLYQAVSAVFTPFYQSDSVVLPFLRDRMFAVAARLPGGGRALASLVAGQWGAPLPPVSVAAMRSAPCSKQV